MTYDELLADIDSKNYRESRTLETPYAALRAVVELHKPYGIEDYPNLRSYCRHCEHLQSQIWPCPTIQAIEKELV